MHFFGVQSVLPSQGRTNFGLMAFWQGRQNYHYQYQHHDDDDDDDYDDDDDDDDDDCLTVIANTLTIFIVDQALLECWYDHASSVFFCLSAPIIAMGLSMGRG